MMRHSAVHEDSGTTKHAPFERVRWLSQVALAADTVNTCPGYPLIMPPHAAE